MAYSVNSKLVEDVLNCSDALKSGSSQLILLANTPLGCFDGADKKETVTFIKIDRKLDKSQMDKLLAVVEQVVKIHGGKGVNFNLQVERS